MLVCTPIGQGAHAFTVKAQAGRCCCYSPEDVCGCCSTCALCQFSSLHRSNASAPPSRAQLSGQGSAESCPTVLPRTPPPTVSTHQRSGQGSQCLGTCGYWEAVALSHSSCDTPGVACHGVPTSLPESRGPWTRATNRQLVGIVADDSAASAPSLPCTGRLACRKRGAREKEVHVVHGDTN